jgi:hypothetical protein
MRIAGIRVRKGLSVTVGIALLVFVAGAGFLASCTVPLFGPAPVQYESVATVVGDRGVLHSVAGLYFTIGNTTDRDITGLEIGFSLYGETGEPIPVFGANSFVAPVAHPIAAEQSCSLCTNLDSHVPPGVVLLTVSRFRVISATFSDGSTWLNPGSYVYAGGRE